VYRSGLSTLNSRATKDAFRTDQVKPRTPRNAAQPADQSPGFEPDEPNPGHAGTLAHPGAQLTPAARPRRDGATEKNDGSGAMPQTRRWCRTGRVGSRARTNPPGMADPMLPYGSPDKPQPGRIPAPRAAGTRPCSRFTMPHILGTAHPRRDCRHRFSRPSERLLIPVPYKCLSWKSGEALTPKRGNPGPCLRSNAWATPSSSHIPRVYFRGFGRGMHLSRR
jgi:hypothetical protein